MISRHRLSRFSSLGSRLAVASFSSCFQGSPAPGIGQIDMHAPAIGARAAPLHQTLRAHPANHLGDGRRPDAESFGKIGHRPSIGIGKQLQDGLLAGMKADLGQEAGRTCSMQSCRTQQTVAERVAVPGFHSCSPTRAHIPRCDQGRTAKVCLSCAASSKAAGSFFCRVGHRSAVGHGPFGSLTPGKVVSTPSKNTEG